MFNGIHHVAIICSDCLRSKRFYVEIVGFKVVRETCREDRKSFKLGLQVGDRYRIELFSFPNPPSLVSSPEECACAISRSKSKMCGTRFAPYEIEELTSNRFGSMRLPNALLFPRP